MAFFKREPTVVERFRCSKSKQAARQKLAEQLSIAETVLGERLVAAERLAMACATNAQLERAEANMRAVEDRAKALRAGLAEFDEQVLSTERALADAKAQRDRELRGGADRGQWLQQLSKLPRDLVLVRSRWSRLSQNGRRRCRKRTGSRRAWMRCVGKLSQLRI